MRPDDERAEYLESGTGSPDDAGRLDLARAVLADDATWAEPPPRVLEGVLAEVRSGRAGTGVDDGHGKSRWPVLAAAVGAVAAVAALVLSTISVLGSAGTTVAMSGTEQEPAASGTALVRPTESGWWIRLDVSGLPPAPDGSYYEGWVWSDDGEGVSIGTFHLRGNPDPVILWSGVALADYPSIWVTLESEDEGPEASELVVLTGRVDPVVGSR